MDSQLTFRTILQRVDPALVAVRRIYEHAFPASERKPTSCFDAMIQREDYAILVAEIPATVVGFAVIFIPPSTNDAALLEYLAVDSNHRSNGVGQSLLQAAITVAGNRPMLVEVESANDPLAVRRREFYRRNGFLMMTDFPYHCPLPNAPPMELMVANIITVPVLDELMRWVRIVYDRVYGVPVTDLRLNQMFRSD